MSIEAGRVSLTESEREAIALALTDALMPYGRDFEPDAAARLLEARLSVLLAVRGERGYHEGWAARAGMSAHCHDCGGLGTTVQGWTDKNGYPEDQYGTCPTCFGHGTTDGEDPS